MADEGTSELGVDDRDCPSRVAIGQLLADTQDRTEAGLDRPSELAPDPLVGLAMIAAALRVAHDDPACQVDEHRRGDVTGVCASQLVMDVLGANGDVRIGRGEGIADGSEGDEWRADDASDALDPGSTGDRDRQLAGLRWSRVHLPVRSDHDGAHARDHARGRPIPAGPGELRDEVSGVGRTVAGVRRARRAAPSPSWGVATSRSIRSSARWTVERWIPRRSASSPRVASGVSRRASATDRTTYGCSASSPLAVSSWIAAIWRPAAPTAR